MTKYNYERMYKELTNEIVQLKGTDELGQTIELTKVINLLNVVEDKEKELVASEAKQLDPPQTNVKPKNENNSIRDFARENRLIKE